MRCIHAPCLLSAAVALLVALPILSLCGCTAVLWGEETFAHQYRPVRPTNIRLFYSPERDDLLVQYSESKDENTNSHPRCYWLDTNTVRINRHRKPHFVSAKNASGLTPVPVSGSSSNTTAAATGALWVSIDPDRDSFTLYSGAEKLDAYELPVYAGSSQRIKQVLLTPFAVAIDATIVGAVIGFYSAPQILAGLSR